MPQLHHPLLIYTTISETLPDEEGFGAVFAESVAYFRRTQPDVYAKVDRIKSRINRSTAPQHQMPFDPRGARECEWCGDDYLPCFPRARWCDKDCASAHRAFNKRRKVLAARRARRESRQTES